MGQARSDYIPTLTGIRALAALLVLVLHANQNFPSLTVGGLRFVHYGYLGVDLFFVLSGFVIAHVYMRHVGRALRVFIWHRFIRLWPAHAAVLAVLVVLVLVAGRAGFKFNEPQAWEFADLPAHVLMLHAWGLVGHAGWNGPSWSISAEWFAYLCFPFIAWGLTRVRPIVAGIIGVFALAALALVFDAAGWQIKFAWLGLPAFTRVLTEFVCGACLYRAIAGTKLKADWIGLAALAAFFVAGSLQAPDIVLIATFPAMLAGAYWAGPIVGAILSARPIEWLGEISYSLYLVHFPLFLVLRRATDALNLRGFLAFAIAMALAVCAAAILFYAVERPARRRLRDFAGPIPSMARTR